MTEGIARRPPAPRREDYAVVDGSRGPRRDFRITVGLREGWDAEGRVYDVSEAVRTARAWMSRRVGAHKPALSGMFTRAEVTYAWPRPTARPAPTGNQLRSSPARRCMPIWDNCPTRRSRRC
jgi:hypothetical protein